MHNLAAACILLYRRAKLNGAVIVPYMPLVAAE